MPTIIMSKPASKLEPSLKKKAYAFLEKLGEDDTSPGLHIEPIANSADDKVRTGRVDQFYRAVLFRVPGKGEPMYVFHGIWPHDDAIAVAKKTRLTVNPVNGVTEITTVAETPAPVSPVTQPPPARAAQPGSASAAPVPLLVSLGLDGKALVDVLGIDESLAVRALAAVDENALMALAESAVEWQGLALIDLATGLSVTDIQDKLSLSEPPAASTETDADRLVEGLRHPAAQMSFAWIENNAELRRVIEGGDFGAWRVFLHPEQRKYARRSYAGPFRLSGGAGTGKTVVLLHRARMLARREPGSRILLTTFTTNLADQLRTDLDRLDPALPMADRPRGTWRLRARDRRAGERGPAAGGSGRRRRRGSRPRSGHDTDRRPHARHRLAGRAGRRRRLALPAALRSTQFLADEYAQVVLAEPASPAGRRTTRCGAPGAAWPSTGPSGPRSGTSSRPTGPRRASPGPSTSPKQRPSPRSTCGGSRGTGAQYVADHVLVDEGQDLGPAHWQLLRALAGEHADDLFIAEDSYQRIYGRRVVLSAFGIRIVGRSQRLTLNYRTTAQNLAYAINVLEGGAYVDLESDQESTARYRSARSGPVPRLIACATLTEELDRAADLVRTWVAETGAPETIAVLVREQRQRDRLVSGLAERGVTIRAVDREHVKPGQPVAMTMHRAKGTEFSKVLLFGIDQGAIPRPLRDEQYAEDAWADALLRERSLLYVAATRARDELALSWNGDPSQLLPELSQPES